MNKRFSILTLAILLSIKIVPSSEDSNAYLNHISDSPIVESEINDYGTKTLHADGSIIQRHTLSKVVSILSRDNRSKVIYPDGTIIEERFYTNAFGKCFITKYPCSGLRKEEHRDGKIHYFTVDEESKKNQITKLPYETMSELRKRIDECRIFTTED